MPESVEKPHSVTLNGVTIMVPVPSIASMRPVLYREYRMPEACFSVGRVLRLRLSHSTRNHITHSNSHL